MLILYFMGVSDYYRLKQKKLIKMMRKKQKERGRETERERERERKEFEVGVCHCHLGVCGGRERNTNPGNMCVLLYLPFPCMPNKI